MSAGVDTGMPVTTTGTVYGWRKPQNNRTALDPSIIGATVTTPLPISLPIKALDVECGYVHSVVVGLDDSAYVCGGVGIDGKDDGSEEQGLCLIDGFSVWHRCAEPKKAVKRQQKWKTYGKYELKGRSKMMAEAEKWGL
jgi:alpha-tubulin suppressor-like RCC1 family protein